MSKEGIVGWAVFLLVTGWMWVGGTRDLTDMTWPGIIAGLVVYAVLWQARYSLRRRSELKRLRSR